MSGWTDSRCGKSWGGLVAQHCPDCHETFSSTGAGDAHRTRDFRCLLPGDVGLVLDERGVWRHPMTDANRERLAKLAAARRPATSVICGPGGPGPIPESPPALPNPAEASTEASTEAKA